MGPLGYQELIFIFVLALLVFGPKKLPELGKTVGKVMSEFRRQTSELKGTWDREMQNMEHESGVAEATRQIDRELAAASVAESYHDPLAYDREYGYESDPEAPATSHSASQEIVPSTDGATATQGAGTTVAELEPPSESAEPASATYVPDTIAREKPGHGDKDGPAES